MSENYLDDDQMEDDQVVEDELDEDQMVEEQSDEDEDDDDDELEEYNDEYQNLLNFIRTHDYDKNLFQYSEKDFYKIINEMSVYMKTLKYLNNRIYLWEIYLQFLLFNSDFMDDRFKKLIVNKFNLISEKDDIDSLNIYLPFFQHLFLLYCYFHNHYKKITNSFLFLLFVLIFVVLLLTKIFWILAWSLSLPLL